MTDLANNPRVAIPAAIMTVMRSLGIDNGKVDYQFENNYRVTFQMPDLQILSAQTIFKSLREAGFAIPFWNISPTQASIIDIAKAA